MSANTVCGSECLDWLLEKRDKASKPTFNTIHSSYTTDFCNQNPGQCKHEVWAKQSLSSLKEVTNSYCKASEEELLLTVKSQRALREELRAEYQDGPLLSPKLAISAG